MNKNNVQILNVNSFQFIKPNQAKRKDKYKAAGREITEASVV